VSGHTPAVGSGREQQPHDPKTRLFPLPGNDFSSSVSPDLGLVL
jgi:hypothetical protein